MQVNQIDEVKKVSGWIATKLSLLNKLDPENEMIRHFTLLAYDGNNANWDNFFDELLSEADDDPEEVLVNFLSDLEDEIEAAFDKNPTTELATEEPAPALP